MTSHQKYLPSCLLMIAALLCSASLGVAATAPNLGAAEDFAVLAGSAVTCTDSTINGDVGVSPGTTVTQTGCTINGTVHANDAAAIAANSAFDSAYNALAATSCDEVLTTLGGQTLAPGVYCVAAAATETGSVLTLTGDPDDVWIFKIGTSGTGALTTTNFSVIMEGGGQPCNVYWWVADAATLTDSNFVGTILAGASITITRGTFTGEAYADDAVTLTNANVTACAQGGDPDDPALSKIKVTGGGQIPVPNPNSTGRATFGFNARLEKSGGATGHFNYVNHVTGLHVNGPVTAIQVIVINPDGSPQTVRFSGTCDTGPQCAYTVTVEDHGEPGTSDEFGIVVTGAVLETQSQRVISQGNIQVHK